MSLRSRLIISYIVIIVVCLLLAFLTLILVARPIQNRLVGIRLITQSRQVALRLNNLYQRHASREDILDRFNAWSAASGAHLLLVDPQLTIVADSQEACTYCPRSEGSDPGSTAMTLRAGYSGRR